VGFLEKQKRSVLHQRMTDCRQFLWNYAAFSIRLGMARPGVCQPNPKVWDFFLEKALQAALKNDRRLPTPLKPCDIFNPFWYSMTGRMPTQPESVGFFFGKSAPGRVEK
jgi:hypothetical protein